MIHRTQENLKTARRLIQIAKEMVERERKALGMDGAVDVDLTTAAAEDALKYVDAVIQRISAPWWHVTGTRVYVCDWSETCALDRVMDEAKDSDTEFQITPCVAADIPADATLLY